MIDYQHCARADCEATTAQGLNVSSHSLRTGAADPEETSDVLISIFIDDQNDSIGRPRGSLSIDADEQELIYQDG